MSVSGAVAALALALGVAACSGRGLSEEGSDQHHQFLLQYTFGEAPRLDLLLVLDNSGGMADKHRLLARALPDLFACLLAVNCEDENGDRTLSEDGDCPEGFGATFTHFTDVHVGVITTSLGGHGGIACSPAEGSTYSPDKDDRGELVAPLRGVPTEGDQGFVTWQGHPWRNGTRDLAALTADVVDIVEAVGEMGCGYEAPLEAMYRFLVDPMPPLQVLNDGVRSFPDGLNTTLLEQRARFLRPDSAVGIVLLTDEDDCSVRDDGPGFFVTGATAGGRVPRGTQRCATDPDDRCCRSCALVESSPPEGCAALDDDPACRQAAFKWEEEHPNLRCYEQKRRFGIDLLYPTRRYVDALTNSEVYGRSCEGDEDCPPSPQQPEGGSCVEVGGGLRYCRYTNPLMSDNPFYPDQIPRSGSEVVFLTGIVGVPWQDVATAETLTDPDHLELIRSTAVAGGESLASRWDTLLGSEATGGYPLDPFMWQSATPRLAGQAHAISGVPYPEANPITGDRPLDPASPGAASPINGHEYQVTDGGSLQYACTYPLYAPVDCEGGWCSCLPADPNLSTNPLCQAPGSAEASTTQRFGKAHPAPRILQVLKDYGFNAGVASACPKLGAKADRDSPAFGYRPAMTSLFGRRFHQGPSRGHGSCFPRSLPVAEDGSPPCLLVEITNARHGIRCDSPGRAPLAPAVAAVALQKYRETGRCDDQPSNPCSGYVLCEMTAAQGEDLERCLGLPDRELGWDTVGYCYLDAGQDRDGDGVARCAYDPEHPDAWRDEPDCLGNPALVDSCPQSARRDLRFPSWSLEIPVPYFNSVVMVACEG